MRLSLTGHAERRERAERATVHFAVLAEGPDRERVVAEVGEGSTALRDLALDYAGRAVEGRGDPVRLGALSMSSWVPTDREGQPAARVHQGRLSVEVDVVDAGALAPLVFAAAGVAGVEVGHIDWFLAPATQRLLDDAVLTEAIEDVVRRAQVAGAAAGCGPLSLVSIDEGGAGGGEVPLLGARQMRAAAAFDHGGGLDVTPREIIVEASVRAVFER